MAARTESLPIQRPAEDEQMFIASQWKLIWWRFIRHRIAMASTVLVLAFYFVALAPEFLAIHDPRAEFASRTFIPPQGVHLFDGFKPTLPYVYGLEGKRNPVNLGMEWQTDEETKHRIHYFVRGHEYKMFGFIKTDWHLMGLNVDTSTAPQPFYPLGSDRMGRDMFSRLMYATRVSMLIGLVGVTLNIFLGSMLGGLSGLRGGLTDAIIQRIIEFLRAIPTIPLWLALSAAVPRDWSILRVYFAITIIISLIEWTRLAREVRGRFLSMREEDFVLAARLYGTNEIRIVFRHMLPSFMSHIIAATTLAIPGIIIAETSLSFLGLGLREPAISWGVLLFEAQTLQAVAEASWLLLPGIFVLVAVMAFNFMGDGLRDAADPYMIRES
jgi:peptide/nickel transport system permease protein